MNHDSDHSSPVPRPPENAFSSLSHADLIRAAADGELPDAMLQALRSADPTFDDRVAFERGLRERVGRVLAEASAPSDLRSRVRSTLRGDPASRLRLVRPEEHPAIYRARPSLARQAVLALAASLALVAGVYFLMPGSVMPGAGTAGPTASSNAQMLSARAVRVVAFVREQHDACAELGEFFERKLTSRTMSEAQKVAGELLNKIPTSLETVAPELHELGYRFSALGPCSVPGSGRSVHALFESPTGQSAPVSLFIQEDLNDYPLDADCAHTTRPGVCKQPLKGGVVTVWRADGLVYYLVAPESIYPGLAKAFRVPEVERSLL